MLIDTHAHISKSNYSDISQVIDDAISSGVLKIINCAENVFSSREIIELSREYMGVMYAAVGVHPLNVNDMGSGDINNLRDMIENEKVIAIGEIGLDYYYSKDNKELQKEVFIKQLELASEYNLPVIIHSREATQDTIDILKRFKLKGVIHCFSGSVEVAREYINMGFMLGIGGVLTFKNSKLKEVIRDVDIKYLVLETDSPFLTPEPYRKYKNEPKYVVRTAEFLSLIKNISIEEVQKITSENAMSIFDFSIYK